MPEIMAQASLFVHGTRYESFGLVLVEAMAAGRPVVAFSVGGIPDVVLDGRTGFLVPYGDIEALAGRVISLLWDSDQRRSMAEQARAWSRRFAWDKISEHWSTLHQSSRANTSSPR
jgi:glycosyltransferase involved in cell wall biosynthesis